MSLFGKIFGASPRPGDEASALVETYVKEVGGGKAANGLDPMPRGTAIGDKILALDREGQAKVVEVLPPLLAECDGQIGPDFAGPPAGTEGVGRWTRHLPPVPRLGLRADRFQPRNCCRSSGGTFTIPSTLPLSPSM